MEYGSNNESVQIEESKKKSLGQKELHTNGHRCPGEHPRHQCRNSHSNHRVHYSDNNVSKPLLGPGVSLFEEV